MRTLEEMPWVLPQSPGNPPSLASVHPLNKIQPISPQDVPTVLDVAFSQLSWLLLRPSVLVYHSFPFPNPLSCSHLQVLDAVSALGPICCWAVGSCPEPLAPAWSSCWILWDSSKVSAHSTVRLSRARPSFYPGPSFTILPCPASP